MKHLRTSRLRLFAAACGVSLLIWMVVPVETQPAIAGAPAVPAFLQPERCYRFTFAIAGAPNWKVLQVLDGGWVRAEVDAGGSTRRDPAWINTAQLVTVREAQCSS